ncbi:MAG: AIR synthase-related protein [Acidimicrobiia bacterium]|nr:AIR synthase-related protein [Acidimicrobiia bacterium]
MAVVGLIDNLDGPPPAAALTDGQKLMVLGATAPELGGSEWAAVVHGLDGGMPPIADLDAAVRLHGLVSALSAERAVAGVHDCSEGGLAVALAEMAFAGACGFTVDVACVPCAGSTTPAEVCFSESASRVVLAVEPVAVEEVLARAEGAGVPAAVVGDAGGGRLIATGAFDIALEDAESAWREAIPAALGVTATSP